MTLSLLVQPGGRAHPENMITEMPQRWLYQKSEMCLNIKSLRSEVAVSCEEFMTVLARYTDLGAAISVTAPPRGNIRRMILNEELQVDRVTQGKLSADWISLQPPSRHRRQVFPTFL